RHEALYRCPRYQRRGAPRDLRGQCPARVSAARRQVEGQRFMTESATIATGFARCEKPERYIQQLVSHWSHKMATSYDEGDGMGVFPFSDVETAVMTAREGGIGITLTAGDAERNVHLRGVIERHLDRFAFREAPLTYEWKDQ